jgi:hypothetical protein
MFLAAPGKKLPICALREQHDRPLDEGIIRTVWMSRDELVACEAAHRSPLVLQCVDDYLRGKRSPLSLIFTHPSVRDHSYV